MSTTRTVKAFFIGAIAGAVAALASQLKVNVVKLQYTAEPEPKAPFMSDESGGSYMYSGAAADPDFADTAAAEHAQALADFDREQAAAGDSDVVLDADHLDDTPEPSESATLIDSLQGIKESGMVADLIKVRVLGLARAKVVAMWGSKGRDGSEGTVFQRFLDLTTEHLLNIKRNSNSVSIDEKRIIDSILEDRVAAGTEDPSILD
jgi:hypothetical protein